MPKRSTEQNAEKGWVRYICHQRSERSFKYHGKPLPLCSRCTGFYPGLILAVILCFTVPYLIEIDKWHFFIIALALIAPMGLDGITQFKGLRYSNNILRFITGISAGIGAGLLFGRILVEIF
ncbi:MAG: DUF2085 domain-containing protein [Thermoplasmata archaeon]|nr:MAG: DUF2085 domain-containing protein [Thermoplasmata archaeon]